MKILNSEQLQKIDQNTIEKQDITSFDLMQRAGIALVKSLLRHYDHHHHFVFVCGSGNNGGDGLIMAKWLIEKGYSASVYRIDFTSQSNENRIAEQLIDTQVHLIKNGQEFELNRSSKTVIVDAILGSGLSRPIEGDLAAVIDKINQSEHTIVSIDLPSGLSDKEIPSDHIITAHLTLAIQIPRYNFFMEDCSKYLGKIEYVDIGLDEDSIHHSTTTSQTIDKKSIAKLWPFGRDQFSHKGTYGHALIVAGSHGMTGAAILATKACLRGGCGKVTAHVPRKSMDIVHLSCPEALIIPDQHELHNSKVDTDGFISVGVGCGIGQNMDTQRMLKQLMQSDIPIVWDADALNIIAAMKWLSSLPKQSILTPHPGEFDRLVGEQLNQRSRILKQMELSKNLGIYIVLKGYHTSISTPQGNVYFNTSGNPGMATAGSGDVLTGLIVSLLAQGFSHETACLAGVYLHGVSGDLALLNGESMESLIASDLINNFGKAFNSIHHL